MPSSAGSGRSRPSRGTGRCRRRRGCRGSPVRGRPGRRSGRSGSRGCSCRCRSKGTSAPVPGGVEPDLGEQAESASRRWTSGRPNGIDLDRQAPAAPEAGDLLAGADEDDQPLRRGGDDLLADQGPAVPLDQVEVGGDLVGPVEGGVELADLFEGGQGDPQLGASSAVAAEVGTPRILKPSRTSGPGPRRTAVAARPVPRPIVVLPSIIARARSAKVMGAKPRARRVTGRDDAASPRSDADAYFDAEACRRRALRARRWRSGPWRPRRPSRG